MPRIVMPDFQLFGRTEFPPELVLYRDLFREPVESLISHSWGLGPPSIDYGDNLTINEETPASDPRVQAFENAQFLLRRRRPNLAPSAIMNAFQILWVGPRWYARVNHQVRGRLTARFLANPDERLKPQLQLLFELLPDDLEHASHYTVFQWRAGGRFSAIVYWDITRFMVDEYSQSELTSQIRRSLPPGGPRSRWDGLLKKTSVNEIPSIFWAVAKDQLDARSLGSRTLDKLEASVRAGQPARRSSLESVPVDDLDEAEGILADRPGPSEAIGEDLRIDAEQAISRLNERSQKILSLSSQGYSDEEIAHSLGISRQAVNKALNAARRKLREVLFG